MTFPCIDLQQIPEHKELSNFQPTSCKVCDQCYQRIGKGLNHKCSKLTRQKTLARIVSESSPKSKGKNIKIYKFIRLFS